MTKETSETSAAAGVSRPLADSVVDDSVVWAMVDASPDAMVLCDRAGSILFANRQVESLFCYERAELLGQPVEVLLPQGLRAGHGAHRRAYAASPSVRAMGQGRRLAGRRRDGSEFAVEIALSPLNVGGQHVALATIRDITDRLAVEAETRYVQQLLDGTRDGVYVLAPDTLSFEYVNLGACEQSGYQRHELIGLTLFQLIPTDSAHLEGLVAPLISGEAQVVRFEDGLRHRNGSIVPVEVAWSFPVREDGQHRLVAVARDASERHRAEHERLKAETAIALADERERVARDLHDTVIQELFAAGMGLEATLFRVSDPTASERINTVVEQIDHAIRHLRTAIFATDRTLASPQFMTTAIRRLVAELDRILANPAQVQLRGPLDHERWHAAQHDVLASLRECLTNVARHARAKQVTVNVTCDEQTLTFEVSDDGVGHRPSVDSPGRGLLNISERARRHQGSFALIAPQPTGNGTVARWIIHAAGHTGPSHRMA